MDVTPPTTTTPPSTPFRLPLFPRLGRGSLGKRKELLLSLYPPWTAFNRFRPHPEWIQGYFAGCFKATYGQGEARLHLFFFKPLSLNLNPDLYPNWGQTAENSQAERIRQLHQRFTPKGIAPMPCQAPFESGGTILVQTQHHLRR